MLATIPQREAGELRHFSQRLALEFAGAKMNLKCPTSPSLSLDDVSRVTSYPEIDTLHNTPVSSHRSVKMEY
jgi:hypothetical protein